MKNEYFCNNNDNDLDNLSGEFNGWNFSYFNQSKESNNIGVFCCQVKCADTLRKEWQQINNYIATTFLFKNKSPFERWNTYLLFSCSESISPALQYEVENNKFAMRKILVADKALDNDELIILLNKKILATDIVIGQASANVFELPALSAVASRLVAEDLNINNVKEFSKSRKRWLDSELERMASSEN